MLKHYLTIAIRNLLKNKHQSLISIVGLAVGVTCFAFCSYALRVSLNWDKNIKDIERICILYSQSETGPKECYENYAADALAKDFPEIESTVSYSQMGGYTDKLCEVKTTDSIVNYFQETFLFANDNFLDFFHIGDLDSRNISQHRLCLCLGCFYCLFLCGFHHFGIPFGHFKFVCSHN